MDKKISIIIPLYNESESLPELHAAISAVMHKEGYNYELIFVDDGSSDSSVDIIKKLIASDPATSLISFRKNFGKAAALQAGFRNCSADYIITMDADLQDDPEEIPNFINMLEEGYDLVSGWKYNRLDPLEKRLPSKIFNKMISWLSGIKLHDFNCGFKAYKREVIKSLDVYGEMHRYIPVIANRYGFIIGELQVNHKVRKYGKSKYGFERYLRGLFDSISVTFISKFSHKPMYLFGSIGLITLTIGFGICVYLTILWCLGHSIGDRPLLLLGVLGIIMGILFFSTGLIADMLLNATYRNSYTESHIKEKITSQHNDSKPAGAKNDE